MVQFNTKQKRVIVCFNNNGISNAVSGEWKRYSSNTTQSAACLSHIHPSIHVNAQMWGGPVWIKPITPDISATVVWLIRWMLFNLCRSACPPRVRIWPSNKSLSWIFAFGLSWGHYLTVILFCFSCQTLSCLRHYLAHLIMFKPLFQGLIRSVSVPLTNEFRADVSYMRELLFVKEVPWWRPIHGVTRLSLDFSWDGTTDSSSPVTLMRISSTLWMDGLPGWSVHQKLLHCLYIL